MTHIDYQVLELTNDEAWAIDFCVRQGDHGKAWGEWGENLLKKVFRVIADTEGNSRATGVILLSGQELWAIENQVRHTYQAGSVPVGRNLLLKIQGAILTLSRDPEMEEQTRDPGARPGPPAEAQDAT